MNDVVLTLDLDWAPDFVIDFVAEQLVTRGVRATWFVTHNSVAVERLRATESLFELGIHPNFLPGSSHGSSPTEVLRHCLELVPDAVSVRTHALVQSSPLLATIMAETPIQRDVSLHLPYAHHLSPFDYHWEGRTILRVPYYWEDDFEMEVPAPCWDLSRIIGQHAGLKVFNFHPIHVFLNSARREPYAQLKGNVPSLNLATPDSLAPYVQDGSGTRSLFFEMLEHLEGHSTFCIRDLDRPRMEGWA